MSLKTATGQDMEAADVSEGDMEATHVSEIIRNGRKRLSE